MLGCEQFGVGDTRHRLLGLQLFSQNAGDEIDTLFVKDGKEKVAVSHIGLLEHLGRSTVARDGKEVCLTFETLKELGMRVNHCDIVIQFGERLRQVDTHFAVAGNDNVHFSNVQKRAAKLRNIWGLTK